MTSSDVCPPNAFACANGQCIPNMKVCDDVSDCIDNSDETSICKGNLKELRTEDFLKPM